MIKISSKLNWSKFLISIIILVSAFSYLAIIAFQSATVYSYTVSELKVASIQDNGSLIRVTGKLLPESYVRLNDSPIAEFMLTDGVENVEAMHSGVLPDLFFNERSEIILEGTYSVSGVFDSERIIVKCPSKYESAEPDDNWLVDTIKDLKNYRVCVQQIFCWFGFGFFAYTSNSFSECRSIWILVKGS